jgi:hypothetical protein
MSDGQEYAETGDYTSIQLLLLQLYNWLAFLLLARQTSNWEMLGPQEEIGWARQLSLSLLSRRLWRDNRPAFVHVLVKKEKLTDEHVRWSVKEYKQQQQTQYNTTAAWRVYIKTGLMLIACCSRLYLTPVWVEKRDLWARPFVPIGRNSYPVYRRNPSHRLVLYNTSLWKEEEVKREKATDRILLYTRTHGENAKQKERI